MTPESWYKQFLRDRGHYNPTGKPLYSYRISLKEYIQLNDVLKLNIAASTDWDACFVIFASEWWRKEYSGGPWSWDTICNHINKRMLSASDRGRIVGAGFKKWGRRVNEDAVGNDFIGTVVLESGLPLKVLEGNHYLPSIITNLYRELGAISSMSREDIEVVRHFAESKLPQSLCKEAFYQLLLQFVITLVRLNERYGFSGTEKPVSVLDQCYPDWRNQFPLRVDGTAGRNFIDNLLAGVTKLQVLKPSFALVKLKLNQTDRWHIDSFLSFSSGFQSIDALGIELNQYENLSYKLELYINTNKGEKRLGFAFKDDNRQGYNFDKINDYPIDDDPRNPIVLFLLDPRTLQQYCPDIPNLNQLYNSELRVFGPVLPGKIPTYDLTATGSCKLIKGQYFIISSSTAVLKKGDWLLLGEILASVETKNVYLVSESCILEEHANSYLVEMAEEILVFDYKFISVRKGLQFYSHDNKNLFIGHPKIYKCRHDGVVIGQIRTGIEYKDPQHGWQKLTKDVVGRVWIRLVEKGMTIFSRTIKVIPEDISFRFDMGARKIIIAGSANCDLTVTGNVKNSISVGAYGHEIYFEKEHTDGTEYCEIYLHPKNNTGKKVVLKVPFPGEQIFFSSTKKKLGNRQQLCLNNLYGSRLYINNLSAEARTYSLVMSLLDDDIREKIGIERKIKVPAFGDMEIAINTLKDPLLSLLSASHNIDSKILLTCNTRHAIEISQFEARVQCDANGIHYSAFNGTGDETHACAFQLEVPFTEESIIDLSLIEGKASWRLPNTTSLWFIYPKAGAGKQFRPVAYRSEGAPKPVIIDGSPEFHKFSLLPENLRLEKFSDVLNNMASDFTHPDWKRLDALYQATEHFRFNAQNAFVVLSDHPKALIAAVFNLRESTIERLSSEYAIPWFRYPVTFWTDSLYRYKELLAKTSLPENLRKAVIDSKLAWIGRHLGLTSIKCILEAQLEEDANKNIIPFAIVKELIAEGFNGAESKPGLRGRHRDKWPEQVCDALAHSYLTLPIQATSLLPDEIQIYQKPFVYMPFIMAAASVFPKSVRLPELTPLDKFRLQQMINFDPEWFYMVYNFTQGYLWKNKSN